MQQLREVGPAGEMPDEMVVQATRLVRQGRRYSLAAPRFHRMPIWGSHPPFQVLGYRSPHGLQVDGAKPWGDVRNEAGLGYMAEVVSSSVHSGAHVDALAHMTIGPRARWYGGGNAEEHLGDFGPTFGDAAKLPPFFTRGVLLDVAGHRGVDCLDAGSPVCVDELRAIAGAEGVEVRRWDVLLVRTGYGGLWPDAEKMAAHTAPGPDISSARWLVERGVIAMGSDTEYFEVQPAPDPGTPSNPQPVHTHTLIENGVHLLEGIWLEELARDRVYEFLFVALPLKIHGATGSMIDPLAIV